MTASYVPAFVTFVLCTIALVVRGSITSKTPRDSWREVIFVWLTFLATCFAFASFMVADRQQPPPSAEATTDRRVLEAGDNYNHGYAAGINGIAPEACPFPNESYRRQLWMTGYSKGFIERQKTKEKQ